MTVTFIFNIIVTPKITYSYRFIIIFFMLKKVPNISNYSTFNSFIFFFQSKKISYIINCSIIYFLFFNLKRFLNSLIEVSSISLFNLKRRLTSLIMLSSNFLSYPSLELFILWEKLIIFSKKIKVYYTPWKGVWKYCL